MKTMNVLVQRECNPPEVGKATRWVQIGKAFPLPGGGFRLKLDTMPIPPWDGVLYLKEPFADDDGRSGNT